MNTTKSLIVRYHLGQLLYVLLTLGLFFATFSVHFPTNFLRVPLILALIPALIDAVKGLLERRMTTEFFLILAIGIAMLGKEEQAITAVLLISMIAKYVEHLVEERTQSAIASLIKLIPNSVIVKIGNQEKIMSLADVQPGMQIVVKTGARIPVDGAIVSGKASINESFLTGESVPQEKTAPELVYAGTFVEAGSIVVQTQKVGIDTMFGKISKLLEQAEKQKAKIATFSDRIAVIMVPLLLVFIAGVWAITRDLNLVITLLVFGSPIELTLVTPIAILAAIVAAFRNGILIKGGRALEQFAFVDTMIFDKTGTLTMGEPKVIAIQPADPSVSQQDIIKAAAIIEKRSGHILSKAILEKAAEEKITIPDPDTYESVTGHGIIATHHNHHYVLGSKHFIQAPEHGNIAIPSTLTCPDETSHTSFYVVCDKKLYGKICVTDRIRPDAAATLQELKQAGITNIMLLSGDKQEVTNLVASGLGIKQAFGEVAPDQKLTMIRDLQKKQHFVAMVGDGINDAPALKQANIGIAMGAMGMEPAIEAADIVLMSNDLAGIIFTRKLAQKVLRLIKQNIIFGMGAVHVLGIILALLHVISPIQAALSHAVSDLLILLNTARLVGFKIKK